MRFAPKHRRTYVVWLSLAAVAAAALILPAGLGEHDPRDVGRVHDGPVRIAVDATHGAQPSHFEASVVRLERHCSACLIFSRPQSRSPQAVPSSQSPVAEAIRLTGGERLQSRVQARRDLSRAPPHLL